jgi:hypothetical protein
MAGWVFLILPFHFLIQAGIYLRLNKKPVGMC